MKLVSIEPTPNPNSMKLNLDVSMPKGVSRTYTAEDRNECPDYIEKLLNVPGVKSASRCSWHSTITPAIWARVGSG